MDIYHPQQEEHNIIMQNLYSTLLPDYSKLLISSLHRFTSLFMDMSATGDFSNIIITIIIITTKKTTKIVTWRFM